MLVALVLGMVMSVSRFTTLVQTEIYKEQLNGSPQTFVQTFIIYKGGILLTLVIR